MLFTSWPYFLVLCRESLCLHLWVTHNVYLPWFGRIMTQFILHHGITLLEDGMLRWAKIRWTWCVRITVCYLFCIWEIPKCPLWSYFPEFSLQSRDACLIIFIVTVFIVMLSVGKEAMTLHLIAVLRESHQLPWCRRRKFFPHCCWWLWSYLKDMGSSQTRWIKLATAIFPLSLIHAHLT